MRVLTKSGLARGVRELCERDADLARVVKRHGPPPLWDREPGFATLVQIILEQQVSLASGRAAYARLLAVAAEATPERVALLEEQLIIGAGITRQKTSYVRALAETIVRGDLDVERLHGLADDTVRAELVKLRGIGPWSADIYLLMALRRADVWPQSDLALAMAMREVKRLRAVPDHERQLEISERWRPWRAVGARILWHHYLSTPRRR